MTVTYIFSSLIDFIKIRASLVSRKERWLDVHDYICPIARYILFSVVIIAGRRRTRNLGPAGEGQARLHNPDMATGGDLDPADIGGTRENSILGGNANRVADEILELPDTTTCIKCDLEVIPPK